MNIHIRSAFVTLVLLLVGCSQEELLERFASKEDQAVATTYIEKLRARDFEALENEIDPSIKPADLRSKLEGMAASIPQGEPTSRKLVGAHSFSTPDSKTLNTTFEYGFGGRWVLINVALKDQNGKRTIVGLNVNPQTQSLEEQNRFTFADKTSKHYAVFAWAIAAALLSLTSLIVCVRTKLPGRKWPWVLFIILGVGKLSLNWATGEVAVAPLSVQLFSAGAAAALYGPWVVSISLPLGAVVFLIYRKVRLGQQVAS